jgi:ribosomal protein S18 acetylase RimI-like enzyme
MGILIRQIEDGDAGCLAAFYNALSEASKRTFHPLGDTTTTERCQEIIAHNHPDGGIKFDLVALDDDRIVGWVFLWNWDTGTPTFGLGVADAYQGQGLGSRLMDAALAYAVERGAVNVTLTVVQDNDKARAMYERRGFMMQSAFVGEDGLPYYAMTADFTKERVHA